MRFADVRGRLGADRVQACFGVPPGRVQCGGGLSAGLFERRLDLGLSLGLRVEFGFQAGDPLVQLVDRDDRLGRDSLRLVPGGLRLPGGLLGANRTGDRLGDALGRLRLDRFHVRFGCGYVTESRHLPDEGVQRAGEPAGQRGDLFGQRVGPPARATRGALRPGLPSSRPRPCRPRPGLPGKLPPAAIGRQPVVGGIVTVCGWTSRSGGCARRLEASRVCARHRLGPVDRHVLGHAHRCPFSLPESHRHRPDKNAPGSENGGPAVTTVVPVDPDGMSPQCATWPASGSI